MASLTDLPELVGFFSYSREDDTDSLGALSALRGRIQGELRGQLGRTAKSFRLWQDKEAIPAGTLWETEIKNAAAQSVFFIPIISPTVVASPYCRFELEAFLAREAELGRSDLVFPILYIDVPALEDSARRQNDPVLSLIAKRQYVDWRKLRHRDVRTTDVSEAVEQFCRHIRDALHRHWLTREEREVQERASALERAEAERKRQEAEAQRREEEARRMEAEAQARERAEEEQRKCEAEAEQRRGGAAQAKLSEDQEEAGEFGLGLTIAGIAVPAPGPPPKSKQPEPPTPPAEPRARPQPATAAGLSIANPFGVVAAAVRAIVQNRAQAFWLGVLVVAPSTILSNVLLLENVRQGVLFGAGWLQLGVLAVVIYLLCWWIRVGRTGIVKSSAAMKFGDVFAFGAVAAAAALVWPIVFDGSGVPNVIQAGAYLTYIWPRNGPYASMTFSAVMGSSLPPATPFVETFTHAASLLPALPFVPFIGGEKFGGGGGKLGHLLLSIPFLLAALALCTLPIAILNVALAALASGLVRSSIMLPVCFLMAATFYVHLLLSAVTIGEFYRRVAASHP